METQAVSKEPKAGWHLNFRVRDQRKEKEKEKEKMKKMIVAVMILVVICSHHMETVEPSSADCLDACQTACVQKDTRLMQRCDRKCQIKCGPDSASQKNVG